MAISSNPSTQKPYSVLLACFILLVAIKVNSAETISFNFPEFTDDESLTLQGDAKIQTDGSLALPNNPSNEYTTSRALYAVPVPIWDNTTGAVASFFTSFSFVIKDFQEYPPADGLVFFLAPYGTEIPSHSSGGRFGILNSADVFSNQFVAVEFDTYINSWDSNPTHIGIDVNTLISLKTVPWKRVAGSLEKVSIIYDSQTKTLTVVVNHETGQISSISQVIDLKSVLPENVSVGFSATTTRGGRERHDIYSWSFTSTLNTIPAMVENINITSHAIA